MKRFKNIEFTCSGYSSAPESFTCCKVVIDKTGRGNHSYEKLNFTNEENKKVGYICITQGKEEAKKEIKRIYRAKENAKNKRKYCSYGFFKEGSKTEFVWVKNLIASNKDIQDRLYNYKEFKRFNDRNNWQHITYTQGEMINKDGKLQMSKTKDVIENISKKALKIYIAG